MMLMAIVGLSIFLFLLQRWLWENLAGIIGVSSRCCIARVRDVGVLGAGTPAHAAHAEAQRTHRDTGQSTQQEGCDADGYEPTPTKSYASGHDQSGEYV
jgi:hypothetical protein